MTDSKKNIAQIMSELFKIDTDSNLEKEGSSDYDFKEKQVNISFEQQCDNVAHVMIATEKSLSGNKRDVVMSKKNATEDKKVIPKKEKEEVNPENQDKKTDSVSSEKKCPEKTVPNNAVEKNKQQDNIKNINFDLPDSIIVMYKSIIDKYPRFSINGNEIDITYKSFYCKKIELLSYILTRFPILDITSMRYEIQNTNLNHQIGDSHVSPDLIRDKIDDTYSCRTRVVSMLTDAHAQLPIWRKSCDMLSSKLWKDHESKGAHKRESLVLDHMSDMVLYVEELDGFIQSATIIDNILKSASDSLSRQLSCLQVKQSSGLSVKNEYLHKETNHPMPVEEEKEDNSTGKDVDYLDSIDPGTIVSDKNKVGVVRENWGIDDSNDPMLEIG